MPVVTSKADAPAVVGGVRQAASLALERYAALGLEEWAVGQAGRDADASIRSIRTFIQVHRLNVDFDCEKSIRSFFVDLWLSGRFVPLAKWSTACPLAAMSGVKSWEGGWLFRELPPRPDWLDEKDDPLGALLPVGSRRLRAVLRTRLHETTKAGRPTSRSRALAWSLLGLKAMMPALWVDAVAESLRDHARLLSSTPPPLPEESAAVLEMVAESVSRLCTPTITPYRDLPRPKLSSSAGWVKLYDQEARRWTTMRGTRAAQYERLRGIAGSSAEELFSMDYRPQSGVVEFRQHPYAFDWSEWDFDPRVSVVALQEPFKIRTISIADGPATAAASPLQRLWHSTLKSLRPFHLIGGARVASEVGKIFAFDGVPFVSGDYSAATDRLSLHATRVVLTTLLRRIALPRALRERLEQSLTSSLLDYSRTLESFRGRVPDELLDSIPLPADTQQKNGQLMGNILSFPILCIINVAAWAQAMLHSDWSPARVVLEGAMRRGYLTREEFDSLPVLVNGDDILFQCQPSDYERWLGLLPHYGFKPSMGKNYYSDEFFTINSELYTKTGFTSRPWWGGFETDLVRLRQELRFETGEDVLSADSRRVLPKMQAFLRETIPTASWSLVNRLWLQRQVEGGLLSPWSGLNWFLPQELGGLGLDPAGHEGFRITYAQRKLAVRMALDPDRGARFLPGVEGSLVSEESDRRLRRLHGGIRMSGELVDLPQGKAVIDQQQPMRVTFWGGVPRVQLRVHRTIDTVVQGSRHVDRWLDHHASGIRLSADAVRCGVTRMLHWGCRVSDKRLGPLEELPLTPRYLCERRVIHVPPVSVVG